MQKFIGLIVGIVMIAAGGFLFYKDNYLNKNCTKEATATVVDMDEEFSADEDGASYMYYPIVEYQVGDNLVTSKMNSGSSTPEYRINEKISILYNPNKTDEFIVKGDKSSKIISIVLLAFGVFVTGYGIVVLVKKKY